MSARVHIIQRAVLDIRVPVQCQRVRDISEIGVLLEESSLVCIIIPGSQVFKSCIWIVAFTVVSVEIYMVRGSKRYLAVGVVLVDCRYPGFVPGDSCYASAAVI